VGAVEGVRLFDIDDLQEAAESNLQARKGEIAGVEAIIEEELTRFDSWLKSQRVLPTISALSRRAEAARLRELNATLARLDLSDAERERVDAMTKAIVKRILHTPLNRLKRDDGIRYLEAVRALFALDEEA
jgi:glutamyl-tRNA reductase